MPAEPRKIVRCAVYTRKSTEEGLEQEFNTLHAQRELAEAYISSQRQENWTILEQHYDDGGFSGANLVRPAMQRLLADVQAGDVDCVVVYKVDRLTRSLLDFSRVIEILDKNEVTFVSVTQQLNTTNSIGRLTLHILLSFAQFERECVSERTRDKMRAARKKGRWIGGWPVFGYDCVPGASKLVVNAAEAERVREIFALYVELGALQPVVEELHRRGWHTKQWRNQNDQILGGKPFRSITLYNLLHNVTYAGRVRHQGAEVSGEQERIISEPLWELVQERLQRNLKHGRVKQPSGALLAGLVQCENCQKKMTHSWTLNRHQGVRHRYYVCIKVPTGGDPHCRRIAAALLEEAVIAQLRSMKRGDQAGSVQEQVARALLQFEVFWDEVDGERKLNFMSRIVKQVSYNGKTGTIKR